MAATSTLIDPPWWWNQQEPQPQQALRRNGSGQQQQQQGQQQSGNVLGVAGATTNADYVHVSTTHDEDVVVLRYALASDLTFADVTVMIHGAEFLGEATQANARSMPMTQTQGEICVNARLVSSVGEPIGAVSETGTAPSTTSVAYPRFALWGAETLTLPIRISELDEHSVIEFTAWGPGACLVGRAWH